VAAHGENRMRVSRWRAFTPSTSCESTSQQKFVAWIPKGLGGKPITEMNQDMEDHSSYQALRDGRQHPACYCK